MTTFLYWFSRPGQARVITSKWLGLGLRVFGESIQDLGFRVIEGFKIYGLSFGLKVSGLGFRVYGFGFWVLGFGFWVLGFGHRV